MLADVVGVIDITVWTVWSGIELMMVATVTADPDICWADDIEFIVLMFIVDVELVPILPGFVFRIEDIGGEIVDEELAE